jgi:hypothetical protein
VVALAVVCATGEAPSLAQAGSGSDYAAVHLEPHAGKTQFKLGDPVIVDLVFSGRSPHFVVKTESGPYVPPIDEVDVASEGGWVRTHGTVRGLGLDLSALKTLTGDAIRVPVLVNRTVTFLRPGHYEISVTTERLRIKETVLKATPPYKCDVCRRTNSVGIDELDRSAADEAAQVAELARTIESAKTDELESAPTAEEKEQFDHEIGEILLGADFSDEDRAKDAALHWKWTEEVRRQAAAMDQRRAKRRDAAVQLACLEGDEAVRAKVWIIAASASGGDADSVDRIMVDGLASSRNKELQLELLEQAWRDPKNVPTFLLQMAMRQSRELRHGAMVVDEAAVAQTDREDMDAVVASLPMRSVENRAETLAFLKRLVVATEGGGLKASR